jgi:hypothetical protein
LLTGDDIQKLSGLDNVRTNFVSKQRLAGQLCSLKEAPALKKEVNDAELCHEADFDHHLSRQVKHSCSCLIRCLQHKGTATHSKKLWITLLKIPLNVSRSVVSSASCLRTVRMASSAPPSATNTHARNVPKAAEHLQGWKTKQKPSNWWPMGGVLEKRQVEEMLTNILAKEDLDEHRSPLSRLTMEANFDQKGSEELADDIAKIASDWKMVLSCLGS